MNQIITEKYVCEIIPVYKKLNRITQFEVKSNIDVIKLIRKIFPKNIIKLQEAFGVIFLDNSNKTTGYKIIHVGGQSFRPVCIKTIMRNALICNASSIIVFHNHPSGYLYPSKSDEVVNDKIKKACEFMDIRLLDSIILNEKSYISSI